MLGALGRGGTNAGMEGVDMPYFMMYNSRRTEKLAGMDGLICERVCEREQASGRLNMLRGRLRKIALMGGLAFLCAKGLICLCDI